MVGERITVLRKRAKLSQEQLAKQLNVSASTIGMYEQGRREPSIRTLIALSQTFGVSLDYLLTGAEASERDVKRIAGILFVLRSDIPGVTDTLLLYEDTLKKVMAVLQHNDTAY